MSVKTVGTSTVTAPAPNAQPNVLTAPAPASAPVSHSKLGLDIATQQSNDPARAQPAVSRDAQVGRLTRKLNQLGILLANDRTMAYRVLATAPSTVMVRKSWLSRERVPQKRWFDSLL